ncbi:TPA: hypothetical protein ACRRYP_004738 [Shigella flexneri]
MVWRSCGVSSALAGISKSPAAPLLPGHAGHGLVGFQLCGLSVVCGLCRRTCDYGGFGNVCCCTCCIRWNLAQIQLWKHRRTLV